MKLAYLILAHKQPLLLKRLINRLQGKKVFFFIHIDTHSNLNDFTSIIKGENIKIISCYKSFWASFNLVKAELALLKLAFKWNAARYVLLSGQDYPIKSKKNIKDFFLENTEIGFIETEKLPDSNWVEHQHGLFRINRFHYYFNKKWKAFPPHSKKKIIGFFLNKLANITHRIFFKKDFIKAYYHGGQWWALTHNQVAYILKKAPRFIPSFKNSYASDELFFQTILCNAPKGLFNLKNSHLHYVYWPNPKAPNPGFLTINQMAELHKTPSLFARKFDEKQSNELMVELDKINL
jgi:hypothetical protein